MKRGAWLVQVAALGLAGSVVMAAAQRRYGEMTDAEISAEITRAQSVADVGQRIQAVSEPFLGTPYVLGNMGEGPDGDGRDKDPRFNVKSADCTTFVEHAMAFALSKDLSEARARLDAIRYVQGKVGYGTRRHWPEAQWVPGLVAEGYLEDVTERLVEKRGKAQRATVTLGAEVFARSKHATGMSLRPEEVPTGTFSVPFVAISDVEKISDRLEPGLVINIVKAPKDGLLVRISHQGLVVKKGGKVFIRNATSVGPKAVVDEPLHEFLERQRKAKAWPTVGFQFLRVTAR